MSLEVCSRCGEEREASEFREDLRPILLCNFCALSVLRGAIESKKCSKCEKILPIANFPNRYRHVCYGCIKNQYSNVRGGLTKPW